MHGSSVSHLAAGVVALVLAVAPVPAGANWLTGLVRETGGQAASRIHLKYGAAGRAAAHVRELPLTVKGPALAAHATPEGHWQFINRDGQTFTAGTADELGRALPQLLPDAVSGSRVALYLSEDSLFGGAGDLLSKLPANADLHVVTARGTFPVIRQLAGHAVGVRENLSLVAESRTAFEQALAALDRPMGKSAIRVLALEPGGPRTLTTSPRVDTNSKAALVDAIDPAELGRSLPNVRGQTAMVAGRIEGDSLVFQPLAGAEQSISLPGLRRAAEEADVNLVILNASVPRQPGGRNWFWQTISIGGLDEAMKSATFADFLESLAANRGAMRLQARESEMGRISISAVPAAGGGLVDTATSYIDGALGHVTGQVVVEALQLDARNMQQQDELDSRLIPGIPAAVQFLYIFGVIAGLLAFAVTSVWFQRLWPSARAGLQPASRLARVTRSALRGAVFVLLFLPVAGGFALIWQSVRQAWTILSAPFRWIAGMLPKAQL